MTIRIRSLNGVLLALGAGCVFDSTGLSAGPPLGGPLDPDASTGSTGAPAMGSTGEPTTTETTSVDATSAGETATGSSTTNPIEPVCGDGVVAGGEECDEGLANADTATCTLECKHAVCGDGYVWAEGGEECDNGPGNGDAYNGCSATCAFGPRCGDGIIQPNYETCDKGPLNGTGQTNDEFAPCSSTCGFFGRILFITGETWIGDLGGVSGADLKCQAAAKASSLPNSTKYRAWLSDDFQWPAERFEQWDSLVPVILVGGTLVAANLGDLAELGPRTGISRTPFGQTLADRRVHTNTSAFGEIFDIIDHCDGWNSSSAQLEARRGYNALPVEQGPDWQDWKSKRWWTSFENGGCHVPAHLYCIDDGEISDPHD